MFDAYGPRVLMLPGTAILGFSIMVTSICETYYQYLLAQGVLFGLGVGLLCVPVSAAIPQCAPLTYVQVLPIPRSHLNPL